VKYAFIRDHSAQFQVRAMCDVLGVSPSGYYEWQARATSQRSSDNEALLALIRKIHHASRGTYGSPRVHAALRRAGHGCGENRVARLMHQHGIRSKVKRPWRVVTTQSRHDLPIAPNLLARRFRVSGENQVWAADITYVWTAEGWLYVAVVIDLYSRRVIGWAMEEHLTRDLALKALWMALDRRQPAPGLIHHSDRGCQYASADYRAELEEYGIRASMSRKGNCYDNAPVESFFHTLKTEMTHFEQYETRNAARQSIFEWIEVFYNRQRLHSTLDYQSPAEYERAARSA
jgi:transposase InsO family protein